MGARFWRLCDALLTAPARPRHGPLGHGRILFGSRTRLFDRPAAALNLVDSIVPGMAAAWSKLALRVQRLPVKCSRLSLLAFGTGDTVFRLGAPLSDFVLKVERLSLGLRLPELTALARRRRNGFDDVVRRYWHVRDTFPRAQFLIVQSPLFGVPAVGALQPYVEGPFRDLVRDVSAEELDRSMARCPRLRAQIAGFLECTIAAWERGGWMVDLGRNNLVLAGEGDGVRLIYLDAEMKEAAGLKGTSREPMYESVIGRMREMLGTLGPRSDGASAVGTTTDPPPPEDPSGSSYSA